MRIITDHKPLVAILKKPLSSAPRRLQALILRTQRYNFTLEYKPGTSIPTADALSRSPLQAETCEQQLHVNNVTFCPITGTRLAEMRDATDKDETMRVLRQVIVSGWPDDKHQLPQAVLPYYSYHDELTVHDGIVLRG